MKFQALIAALTSAILFFFMINPAFGFFPVINTTIVSLDYFLLWSISYIDAASIAVIPLIVFALIQTGEKRTIKHQLALTSLYIIGSLLFFVFGFLMITLKTSDNPLFPSFLKVQPFSHYWALCFGLSHLLITGMYLFDRKRKRDERKAID